MKHMNLFCLLYASRHTYVCLFMQAEVHVLEWNW